MLTLGKQRQSRYLLGDRGGKRSIRMAPGDNGGKPQQTRLIIVTGVSGSGRASAMRVLEDLRLLLRR